MAKIIFKTANTTQEQFQIAEALQAAISPVSEAYKNKRIVWEDKDLVFTGEKEELAVLTCWFDGYFVGLDQKDGII